MEERKIVSFYELSDEWKNEALNNLEVEAFETHYLEPLPNVSPEEHILWDLTECMSMKGEIKGFKYNAVINISNNTSMLLNIDEDFENAKILIV